MPRYLVDANLPFYFSLWRTDDFIHQFNLGADWSDSMVWDYAKENNLTILSKDADFSNRILLVTPPPKVVHFRIGNMKLNAFFDFVTKIWPEVEDLIHKNNNKLVNVYLDRLEAYS